MLQVVKLVDDYITLPLSNLAHYTHFFHLLLLSLKLSHHLHPSYQEHQKPTSL
ncbi:hypothetical protein HanIR_Chr13g0663291 [Helianthus annuus]|nr:hypothetical protein HanIR_Chr13g0663291 [Helianthus annuus]